MNNSYPLGEKEQKSNARDVGTRARISNREQCVLFVSDRSLITPGISPPPSHLVSVKTHVSTRGDKKSSRKVGPWFSFSFFFFFSLRNCGKYLIFTYETGNYRGTFLLADGTFFPGFGIVEIFPTHRFSSAEKHESNFDLEIFKI